MEQASAGQDGTNGVRRSMRTRSSLQNACGKAETHTSLSSSTNKNNSKITKQSCTSTIRRNYLLMLRREIDRLRKIQKRSLETPEQRKARLEQQRLYKIKKRQNETPSQRKIRLERDRLHKKLVRKGKALPQPPKLMYQILMGEDGNSPSAPQPNIEKHKKHALKPKQRCKQQKCKRKPQNKSIISEDEVLPEHSQPNIIENPKKQRLKSDSKSKYQKCKSKTQNKSKQCESAHQNMHNTDENIPNITIIKKEYEKSYHQQNKKITIEIPHVNAQIYGTYHDAEEMPEYPTENIIPNESEYSPQIQHSPESNHTHPERLIRIIPDNGLFHISEELVKHEHSTSHVLEVFVKNEQSTSHIPEVYVKNELGISHIPEELANIESNASYLPEIFVNNEHGTLHAPVEFVSHGTSHMPEEYEEQEEETIILGA